ncbi:uncharacterized protein LOC116344306 [Contarinia nasturtii]|uniref:uncharacterized protein LOC116344306 n=1 Tax=Contarinia nasturtii TaxID=265458 RepID=UPI0012D426E3|nr:uncharacterized protein LOC116344306 [Contarinia nasturtii]
MNFNEYTEAVVLPTMPLNINDYPLQKLPIAISYDLGMLTYTKKMNVYFWPDNICALMNSDENETNLMCIDIEDECPDCDICQFQFTEPIFHVVDDGFHLLGLPKHCKRTANLWNKYTYQYELKSSAVYVPVAHYLPWIHGILSERCHCKTEANSHSILRYTKGIIF